MAGSCGVTRRHTHAENNSVRLDTRCGALSRFFRAMLIADRNHRCGFTQWGYEVGSRFIERQRRPDPDDRNTAKHHFLSDNRDSDRSCFAIELPLASDSETSLRGFRNHPGQSLRLEKGRSSTSLMRRKCAMITSRSRGEHAARQARPVEVLSMGRRLPIMPRSIDSGLRRCVVSWITIAALS